MTKRQRELAEEFDRFLAERVEAGEPQAAVLARFPMLSRLWEARKSTRTDLQSSVQPARFVEFEDFKSPAGDDVADCRLRGLRAAWQAD